MYFERKGNFNYETILETMNHIFSSLVTLICTSCHLIRHFSKATCTLCSAARVEHHFRSQKTRRRQSMANLLVE